MNGGFIEGAEGPDDFDPEVVAEAQSEGMRAKDDADAEAVEFLRRRMEAYRRVFSGAEPMADDVSLVMKDLSKFCREGTSTFHPDARLHALLEGRREVLLRIKDHTDLTLDALIEKYTSPNNP